MSNALGTSVGSKALTVRQAIVVGAVCEFLGSLVGGEVAGTISGGILEPALFAGSDGVDLYARLMFTTMAGAFAWLGTATYFALPVSTTHSMVGSLVGVGVVAKSWDAVQYRSLAMIGSRPPLRVARLLRRGLTPTPHTLRCSELLDHIPAHGRHNLVSPLLRATRVRALRTKPRRRRRRRPALLRRRHRGHAVHIPGTGRPQGVPARPAVRRRRRRGDRRSDHPALPPPAGHQAAGGQARRGRAPRRGERRDGGSCLHLCPSVRAHRRRPLSHWPRWRRQA